jgi:phosphatidylserine/phosphatidylglycerophosphate/cardiolipin synthase-like enzyme
MLDSRHAHQRLLVMPEDGAAVVVELIDAAREQLLLKQFKLQSELVMEALLRAQARGVKVRVMLNPRLHLQHHHRQQTLKFVHYHHRHHRHRQCMPRHWYC